MKLGKHYFLFCVCFWSLCSGRLTYYIEKFIGEKAKPSCRLMQQHFFSQNLYHSKKNRGIFLRGKKVQLLLRCFFALLKVSHEILSAWRTSFVSFCLCSISVVWPILHCQLSLFYVMVIMLFFFPRQVLKIKLYQIKHIYCTASIITFCTLKKH